MMRFQPNPWGLVLALVALTSGAVLATDDGERGVRRETVRIGIDDDGNRHSFEFDTDRPRPFLGVRLGRAEAGARVEEVIEGSAAERAGLRPGDVIIGFAGESIDSPWDLTVRVLSSQPGEPVDLEIARDGRTERLSAELGETDAPMLGALDFGFDTEAFEAHMRELQDRLGDMDFFFDSGEFERHLEGLGEGLQLLELGPLFRHHGHAGAWALGAPPPLLGVELVQATPELREHLGGDPAAGVLVSNVLAGTPAESAGVKVGDLIVSVEGKPIGDTRDLRRALGERPGETFGLEVIRDGERLSLTVTLPARDEGRGVGSPSLFAPRKRMTDGAGKV